MMTQTSTEIDTDRFFRLHCVNRRTEQVVLDLLDDVFEVTGLSPYLVNDSGDLCVRFSDGTDSVYEVTNGQGALPDGRSFMLTHAGVVLLLRGGMDASVLARAQTNEFACSEVFRVQNALERAYSERSA